MPTVQEPSVPAVVLSDLVIREHGTGKLTLVGCFGMLNVPQLPFVARPFYVTAFISNLRPPLDALDVVANIIEPGTGRVLASSAGHVEFHSHGQGLSDAAVIEIPIPISPFNIPSAGTYHVRILINGNESGHRTLIVNPITAAAPPRQISENNA